MSFRLALKAMGILPTSFPWSFLLALVLLSLFSDIFGICRSLLQVTPKQQQKWYICIITSPRLRSRLYSRGATRKYHKAPYRQRREEGPGTRVLVAFEDDYRAYADALANTFKAARPHLNVVTIGLAALQTELARFDPHLVICSSSNPAAKQDGRLSWVELSVDPHQPSRFCVDGRRWESSNPSLEELLGVVEETEQLVLNSNRWRSGAC